MFRAPNTITYSAHLYQTTATKDGAQIEKHFVRYTQPEGIGYLVGTVCRGRSNFVNQNLTSRATESDKR